MLSIGIGIGIGNAPFSLISAGTKVMGGLIAWREAMKAAMFLTTDDATAQVRLLLVLNAARIGPIGDGAPVKMEDHGAAFVGRPTLAAADFAAHQAAIALFCPSDSATRATLHQLAE